MHNQQQGGFHRATQTGGQEGERHKGACKLRGSIKWHMEDDQALVHVIIIRGAYLIPDAPT